jgi:ABC-type bacteriocin/lantibiotic exporter with double-glycine peptidase domain
VDLGVKFQDSEGQMTRLDDVLKYPTDPVIQRYSNEFNPEKIENKLTGYVEFKEVNFGYNPRAKAFINNINLVLEPGKRVAVVGGSGSGKSTIAKLLCGVYEPWEGNIYFDGKTIDEIPREVMVNSLSLVDQDIFLFEGNVKENIALWDNSIEEHDVINASKDAAIHDIITARQGGYGNLVEEGGSNFSGGQRQRLEIARALATNPTILVLDEATSALDPTTEKFINNAILSRSCSSLTIAHRLSTIRDCDEIIVMENGQIVQRGTHNEMIDIEGAYRDLVHAG